jgi:predicted transcriptional regulator
MKNRRNGWPARRRRKRERDRIARNLFGYADHRSMCDAWNVEELRGILEEINRTFVPNAPVPENADGKLFDTRVVAEAIGSMPKVVRHLVFTHQLEPEPLRSERARKLFFRPSAIHKFLSSRAIHPGSEVLRSATIAANPRGVGGFGLTKNEAAKHLEISKRAVERYLVSGLLRRTAVSSKRLTLITYESVHELVTRLIDQEDREYKRLMKLLAKHFAGVSKDGRRTLMMEVMGF